MRVISFLKFYIISIAFLFIFYSFYDLGLRREILVFLAASLLSPQIFKVAVRARGVRRGDVVLVSAKSQNTLGFFLQKFPARALGSGRIGEVIDLEYNFKNAKGEIVSYGGIFFPAEVNILYYEEPLKVVNK
ncbi:MAG: hypothetical protein QME59_01980 [Candidatus Hydrothermarchaeota archaeon]|nr:hypothetical protein [Candidatus Hydrothermarchaeota archaeon]